MPRKKKNQPNLTSKKSNNSPSLLSSLNKTILILIAVIVIATFVLTSLLPLFI